MEWHHHRLQEMHKEQQEQQALVGVVELQPVARVSGQRARNVDQVVLLHTMCAWCHTLAVVSSSVPQQRVLVLNVLGTKSATPTTLSSAVVIVSKVNAPFVIHKLL